MKLVKYGTKDGMKYGLKHMGRIVIQPKYDSPEELLKDPYFSKNETKKQTDEKEQ